MIATKINYQFLAEKIYQIVPVLFLLLIIPVSLTFYFSDKPHTSLHYWGSGAYLSFSSLLLFYLSDKAGVKQRTYVVIACAYFIVGVVALFVLSDMKIIQQPVHLFLLTYYGAVLGLMAGAVVFNKIFK